jgi:hypothetical protein
MSTASQMRGFSGPEYTSSSIMAKRLRLSEKYTPPGHYLRRGCGRAGDRRSIRAAAAAPRREHPRYGGAWHETHRHDPQSASLSVYRSRDFRADIARRGAAGLSAADQLIHYPAAAISAFGKIAIGIRPSIEIGHQVAMRLDKAQPGLVR